MAIKSLTIKTGATLAPSGGSDLAFVAIGGSRSGTTRIAPSSDTTMVSRRSADWQFVPGAVSGGDPTGYGRDNWYVSYRIPRDVFGDGSLYLPAFYRLHVTEPVTTSAANKTAARLDFLQFGFDSESTDFFSLGSQD